MTFGKSYAILKIQKRKGRTKTMTIDRRIARTTTSQVCIRPATAPHSDTADHKPTRKETPVYRLN